MRQVIPNIYDTFTEEGGPGTVAAEVFEQFIWLTTGVKGRTPFKEISGPTITASVYGRWVKTPALFFNIWHSFVELKTVTK